MKTRIIQTTTAICTLLISVNAFAWYPPKDKKGDGGPTDKAAGCSPSTARSFLSFNNVYALIETGGSMWQDRAKNTPAYFVPKPNLAGGSAAGPCVFYAGALWMGGVDVNGQLKLAAHEYRANGTDFWPGPLSQTPFSGNYDPTNPVSGHVIRDYGAATITPDQCEKYDQFYPIKKADVIQFSAWWECNNTGGTDCVYPDAESMNRILNWPAHGDVGRGQDYYLAPFFDRQKDGDEYDPMGDGDYPWYDLEGDIDCRNDRRVTLFGDSTTWWVFNDKGNIHTETGGQPIGMEIHAQAFCFATDDQVNDMTFYNYEMINRGTQTLYNTYFAQFADLEIGGNQDDYVGCDVSRGLGYGFNGDAFDANQGSETGYGSLPPAAGIDFFEGPYQDDDGMDNPGPTEDSLGNVTIPTVAAARAGKGIVYSGLGIGYGDGVVDNERYGMIRYVYFNLAGVGGAIAGVNDDPSTATDFYRYMLGIWKDGTNMTYGGTGHVSSTVKTNYMFPSDSDPMGWGQPDQTTPMAPWDEVASGNPPGDRRFVQAAGPFTLTPGAVNNITVGVVYARSSESDIWASVRDLKVADTKAQALFDNCFQILEPPNAPKLQIQELENELILMISNPTGSNNFNEGYIKQDKVNIIDPNDSTNYDKFYRFQGYQIYQLKDATVSVSQIEDNDYARLIAQCDLKDSIGGKIINYNFNEALGVAEPDLMVSASANEGIKHSFKVTEDQFATTTAKNLVNHKTYYYIAVAYGYNNYKTYNPTQPLALDGQKKPYLRSRLSYNGGTIEAVPAIPHNPMPQAGGTYQQVPYGTTPEITRVEGVGNSGLAVDLTQASVDAIMANDSLQHIEYAQNGGPIEVKVVDPLNVAKGFFVLKFNNYSAPIVPKPVNYPSDSAKWVIYHYDAKGGSLIDSVTSDMTIERENEQIIPDWGVSVDIYQYKYHTSGAATPSYSNLVTDPIEATIAYTDSSFRWLGGVPDAESSNPMNWILSGTFNPTGADTSTATDFSGGKYKDKSTRDYDQKYENLISRTFTHFALVGSLATGAPIHSNSKLNATSAQIAATMCDAVSVDLVFTSDKSKWTRCPVIEMCQDKTLSQGNAEVSMMRKAPSVDKNGYSAGESGYNPAEGDVISTTGMGWFPGYAIDVETGHRLNMAFGENSYLAGENGADMQWNPTGNFVNQYGAYVFGGMHTIYIMGTNIGTTPGGYTTSPGYDQGAWMSTMINPTATSTSHKLAWQNCMWVMYPMLAPEQKLMATDVKIRMRVAKEYRNYATTGENNARPIYEWDADAMATIVNSDNALNDALKLINVVPNPYYAFSEYEQSRLDTRVKITNLPEKCNIQIFNIRGKLIRSYKKDSPITSLDWDLKNTAGIPVAGGVYLIHVEVPDVGERVIKWFGGIRQPDMQNL